MHHSIVCIACPMHWDDDAGALIEPLAVAVHDVRRAKVGIGRPRGCYWRRPDWDAGCNGGAIGWGRGGDFRSESLSFGKARALGFEIVNPLETDLIAYTEDWTEGAGADLVFEVSGSVPGAKVHDGVGTGSRDYCAGWGTR